jgi:hypothetical protein
MNADGYVIRRAVATPELRGEWEGPAWARAEVAEVAHFHPNSSAHRPSTRVKVLYDDAGIYVHFRVADRYVKCVETQHQGRVWRDSCVEFFVQPKPPGPYFNIEMNCGGTMLLYLIEDPTRTAAGKISGYRVLPPELLATVRIYHSLPRCVPEEITDPVEWSLEYFMPHALMDQYVGPLGPPAQRRWRGNFYKCADGSSHPHWAAWAPIERLDFHQPDCFGSLTFEAG